MNTNAHINREQLHLSTSYVAPQNSLQNSLCEICREAFSLDHIGIDDDFFELGGDSLIAVRICVGISAKIDRVLQPGIIARHQTVRKLCAMLQQKAKHSDLLQCLQTGKRGKTPVVILPGNSGYTALAPAFLEHLGKDTPVYSLQIPGLSTIAILPPTIEALAQVFVNELCDFERIHLVTFCGTAVVTLHMLELFRHRKPVIDKLVLVDPSFGLALAHFYEKRRATGKTFALSVPAFIRMKMLVMRKLGRWNPPIAVYSQPVAGRFIGSEAHRAEVAALWADNLESAVEATSSYALLLKRACPLPYEGRCYIMSSQGYLQGRSRAEADAAHIFVPNAQWQKLVAKSHEDMFTKNLLHLATAMRDIFCIPN